MTKKYELILIILFSQYLLINCYFEKSPFIKDFPKIEDYENEFKTNKFKYGFMLIYSKYCGHCRHFVPNYIKLSELFHNELFFYALGASSNYNKKFQINGFPTILFYSNENYKEILFGRSVSKISKFIREHIKYNCTEISYNNIDLVYNEVFQKEDRNLLIGYFKNNSEHIKTFTSITNNLKNDYIDLCYYCTDFNLIKKDKEDKYKELSIFQNIKENEVRSYSHKRGNNTFIFNNNEKEASNIFNYEKFLFDNVINIYEEIQNEEEINILNKLKNKNLLVFSYDNDYTKEKYIKNIMELYNMTTNKKDNIYYYILLNKNIRDSKFNNFQKNEIHFASNNLSEIKIIKDFEIIKQKIINNSIKNSNINLTNNKKDENNNVNITNIISNNIDNVDLVDLGEEKQILNININNNNFTKENSSIKDVLLKNDFKNINKNNKIMNNNHYNIKRKTKYNHKDFEEEELTQEPKSNKNLYILLILIIFAITIYIICKKFLCVGFIKVYDSQIIEFNQPNKIEIV